MAPTDRKFDARDVERRPGDPSILVADAIREVASGVLSMSPRNRTSPWRPSSARATEIFILEVSRPTKILLFSCMARPVCVRIGVGLSDATLARRIAWTSHICTDNEHTVCQMFSWPLSSGARGGSGMSEILLGTLRTLPPCQPT